MEQELCERKHLHHSRKGTCTIDVYSRSINPLSARTRARPGDLLGKVYISQGDCGTRSLAQCQSAPCRAATAYRGLCTGKSRRRRRKETKKMSTKIRRRCFQVSDDLAHASELGYSTLGGLKTRFFLNECPRTRTTTPHFVLRSRVPCDRGSFRVRALESHK